MVGGLNKLWTSVCTTFYSFWNWALVACKHNYPALSPRASFFTTGASIGTLIGLSSSPILGVVITGAFGLITILLQGWNDKRRDESSTLPVISPVWVPWLPLGFVAGALIGIWMRANDSLNFHQDIRHKYRAMGFSKYQAERIVDAAAVDALGHHRNIPDQLRVMGFDSDQIALIMKRLAETIDVGEVLKVKDATLLKNPPLLGRAQPSLGAGSSVPQVSGQVASISESPTRLYAGISSGWFAELKTKMEEWKFLTEKQRVDEVHTIRALIGEVRLLSSGDAPEGTKLLESYDHFLTDLLNDKDGLTIGERWQLLSSKRDELNTKIARFFEPKEVPQ